MQVNVPTGGATVDITYGSSIGTPVGCIIKMSRGGIPNLGSHVEWSLGCMDATSEWVFASNIQNKSASVRYGRRATNQCVMLINSTGGVVAELSFNSFITDGVRLNVDTAFASATAHQLTVTFQIGGEADVGTLQIVSNPTSQTVGFKPDGIPILLGGYNILFSDTAQAGSIYHSLGFGGWDADDVITQGSMAWTNGHNAAQLRFESSLVTDTTHIARDHDTLILDDYTTLTGRDSTSFELIRTSVASGSLGTYGYYAFKGATPKAVVVKTEQFSITTPLSYTGYGSPEAIFFHSTTSLVINTVDKSYNASAMGMGVATSASEEFAISWACKDGSGVNDGDTKCGEETRACAAYGWTVPFGNSGDASYSVSAFEADGFELTKHVTVGTSRFQAFVISDSPSVGTRIVKLDGIVRASKIVLTG